jgi:hypothetical protein
VLCKHLLLFIKIQKDQKMHETPKQHTDKFYKERHTCILSLSNDTETQSVRDPKASIQISFTKKGRHAYKSQSNNNNSIKDKANAYTTESSKAKRR